MKSSEIIKELRRLGGSIEGMKNIGGIMSRATLARVYGIPLRTIENWESGVNEPPVYVVDLLARAIVTDLTGRPAEFRVTSRKIGTSGEAAGDEFDILTGNSLTAAIAAAERDREDSAGKYLTEIKIYFEDIDDEDCTCFDCDIFEF